MTIFNIKNNEYEYKRINLNLKSIGEKCFIESLDFNKGNQSFEIHHNRFELLMNNYISDLKDGYKYSFFFNVFENKEIKIDYFSFLKDYFSSNLEILYLSLSMSFQSISL